MTTRMGVALCLTLILGGFDFGWSQVPVTPTPGNEIDSLLQRPTHFQRQARVEDETGIARAVYAPRNPRLTARSDDEIARATLGTDNRIGWSGRYDDLRLIDERRSPAGKHLTYQQYLGEVPVHGRYTRVSLDRAGKPTFIVNGFAPRLERLTDFDTHPSVTRSEARSTSETVFPDGVTLLGETDLVVLPLDPPVLAWKTLLWPDDGGEYEIRVDAHSGEIVSVADLTLHKAARASDHAARSLPDARAHASDHTEAVNTAVEGQGLVFDPDPLASSGKSYEPPYVDADDFDSPELNAERKLVTLHDVTLGPDQLHRLIGPHVEVTGRRSNGQINYNPPEELNADGFAYTRADERFEAVMVYYHIDKSQRYVQSLGFDDVQNSPLPVNPFGEGDADVSNYYLNLNYLALGGGGVDDAEDAFVIWHEYAHSLLNAQVPGLANTFDGTALHEGWSDYWAASYQRELFEQGELPAGNWKRFFRWDGNNPAINWFGRTLPDFKMYPTDLTKTSVHLDGLVWASALMAIYDRLGKQLTDQLNIQSHSYLAAPATMEDAAYAMIQADVDLYGGEHAGDLVSVLAQRGFVDASTFRTIVEHESLPDTEQLGGTVEVVAEVTSIVSQVASVTVYYAGQDISGSSPMTSDDGVLYRATIPLPDSPSIVTYYIEAVDEQNQTIRLPEGAPDTPFVFVAGPDSEAPVITHDPLTQTSIYGWPPSIQAGVADNIAIDTVFAEFTITDNESSVVLADSSFGLVADGEHFRGSFPTVDFTLRGRETVTYRIHAIDASASRNQALLPTGENAPFVFDLSISGTVVRYDFEQDAGGSTATGSWERGTPTFGPLFPHSGTSAWVTDLDDSYPATQNLAILTLPPIDLGGLDTVWLEFWHWYDIEHDGTAEPGSEVEATLWDGGNVQMSLDGGVTWEVITPQGGYDGVIATGGGNPMQGQPAFGGYSYGWRRELVEIPGGQSVSIRFAFGTDVSNAESSFGFIGWMIDDVVFMVDTPTDADEPEVLQGPPPTVEISGGSNPVPATISVGLEDDTGIESVIAAYSITGSQGSASGITRLAMSFGDPTQFQGDIPVPENLAAPGTTVEYEITARDFDGNQIVLPGGSQQYRISYVLVEETNVASQATPSGGWTPTVDGWRIDAENHGGRTASLVFPPMDLPVDATDISFEFAHSYRLQSGATGRLSVSVGDADTWEPIDPDNGYPNATSVFVGLASDVTSVYSLDVYAGRHVWIRLEMVAQQPLSNEDFWDVSSARMVFKGAATEFEIPRSLELHPNFPNPFAGSTTITYAVPVETNVRIEAFDILGRRIETLRDGLHEAGTYTLHWQPNIAPGLYVIRLTADAREKYIRVTMTR